MTDVAFHFNAPDKVAYACRFARKVLRSGARLAIVGAEDVLDELDRRLWALSPHDFIAHCREGRDADMWALSPVLLAERTDDVPHSDVLLNLGEQIPAGFERFAKVVEVVSADDALDRQVARERWRGYTAKGYTLVRHDLVLQGG